MTVVIHNGPNWTDVGLFLVGLATLLVIFGGAFFTLAQVRTAVAQLKAAYQQSVIAERSAALQTLSLLANRWESALLIRARQRVNQAGSELTKCLNEWEQGNATEFFEVIALLQFFEELGFTYMHEGSGDFVKEYIKEMHGPASRHYFELFRQYVSEYRNKDDQDFGRYFEKLATSCA